MTLQLAIASAAPDFVPGAISPWSDAGTPPVDLPVAGIVLRFQQDQEIFGEGEEAACYYKVISGVVRTCKFFSDGRRQIDSFHVAGDLFGIELGQVHGLSAEAVSDCKIVAYRRVAVDKAGNGSAVSAPLFVQVIRNLARAQEHAVLLGRRCAAEKVAAFLLNWAQQSAATGTITLAMTRQDIGDYLGLTIETVSRTLSQMERDAVIELPSVRQIRVKDIGALTRLNG